MHTKPEEIRDTLEFYGEDILASQTFRASDKNIQHGDVSVMEHSISVSYVCIKIAKIAHIKCDYASLVRGSLLHDYFNYDWHKHEGHLHGYRHADIALKNAADEFAINPKEANMIQRHMFPLNIRPPKCKEGIILCIADKACALHEIFHRPYYDKEIQDMKHAC